MRIVHALGVVALSAAAIIPIRPLGAQTPGACWSTAEIRAKLYFWTSKEFQATPLGGCAFRVDAKTPMGSERDPKKVVALVTDRFDAVFVRGQEPRYLAVYSLGTIDQRGECYDAPCVFDAKGRLGKEKVTVAEAEATSARLVASQKVASAAQPDLKPWDGTFNGFTASNGYSLRVLGGVMKFSMVNPYAASGHIEEVIDCEGRWEAPSGRASFALRVKMACAKGPAQLTPFLTYNADLDAWLMTPNAGSPIKMARTARVTSM